MKIDSVMVSSHYIELSRPYEIAFTVFEGIRIVKIEILMSNGIIGYGTGTPSSYVTGETIEMSMAVLDKRIIQDVTGIDAKNPLEILSLITPRLVDTPAALSAIDIALYDAFSKNKGKSLVEYLGGSDRALPTSITIGIKDTLDLMLQEAKEYVTRGFRVIKLKLGRNLEDDIEYTKHLRSFLNKEVKVYVDPNQGYSIKDFKKFLRATKDLNIEFVEQPVSVDDTDMLLDLSDNEKKLVCIDESMHTLSDLKRWANRLVFPGQLLNIKLMKCGGIHQASLIAQFAKSHDLDLMIGCMDESCASIAAALHFAYSQKNTRYIDLDGSLDLKQDIFSGGFDIIDGFMRLRSSPGLGLNC